MYALLLAHNADESAVLRLTLQRAGLAARISTEIQHILESWQAQPSDLILLSFQDGAPLDSIKELRSQTDAPIALVTNPIGEDFHVELFEAGVDLVVFRPYSARLLIAQLRSLLRRATGMRTFHLPSFTIGDLTLDPSVRTIQIRDEEPKHLTRLEFQLLYTLMVYNGQVLSTETLVENVWGYSGRGDRDLVRGLVKRLRSKVEPASQQPRYILTIPGVGYKFSGH